MLCGKAPGRENLLCVVSQCYISYCRDRNCPQAPAIDFARVGYEGVPIKTATRNRAHVNYRSIGWLNIEKNFYVIEIIWTADISYGSLLHRRFALGNMRRTLPGTRSSGNWRCMALNGFLDLKQAECLDEALQR
jgi:hypothetical protein